MPIFVTFVTAGVLFDGAFSLVSILFVLHVEKLLHKHENNPEVSGYNGNRIVIIFYS